jgi:hypothetical protein
MFNFERFLDFIKKEWSVISSDPWSFILFGILISSLSFYLSKLWFNRILENNKSENTAIKAKNENLEERLKYKTEQLDHYANNSQKQDEEIDKLIKSDNPSLQKDVLEFINNLHNFIERHKKIDDDISSENDNERIKNPDTAWNDYIAKSNSHYTSLGIEYNRLFRAKATLFRDELKSRLKNYKPTKNVDWAYDYPTNYFGYQDVAEDLQKMAYLL